MEKAEGRNQTPILEFIITGFGNVPELQSLLFLLFLAIYIATMAGNILIVVLVAVDHNLHTPMYFFLGNLSCVETCYTTIILPRLLASLLTGERTISVKGCITQSHIFGIVITAESVLLGVMSYDRYFAICHPLRYTALMNGRVCGQLVVGSWLSGFLLCSIINLFLYQSTLCGSNEIDNFFCDFSPMSHPYCGDSQTQQIVTFIITIIAALGPFLMTLTSYICIIATILRIPSTTGRQKAFSTCSSHLIVLAVSYGTVTTVYLVPTTHTPKFLHKIFSVCYAVLVPLLTPVVYSLRNKEVKEALRKATFKMIAFQKEA